MTSWVAIPSFRTVPISLHKRTRGIRSAGQLGKVRWAFCPWPLRVTISLMPKRDDVIGHARDLHRQARWDDACLEFLAADAEQELGVEDLELLGEAAQLTGRHDEAVSALERAFEPCNSD